jgi:hypothetical protein
METFHEVHLLKGYPQEWHPTGQITDREGWVHPTFNRAASKEEAEFQLHINEEMFWRHLDKQKLVETQSLQSAADGLRDFKNLRFEPRIVGASTTMDQFQGVALVFVGTHGEWLLGDELAWDLFETPIAVQYLNQTSCGIPNYYSYHLPEKHLGELLAVPFTEPYAEGVQAAMNQEACDSKHNPEHKHLPCRKDAEYMADRAGEYTVLRSVKKGEVMPNKIFIMENGSLAVLRRSYIIDPHTKRYIAFENDFSLQQLLRWLAEHGIARAVVADYSCNVFNGQVCEANIVHKGKVIPWKTVKERLPKNGWEKGGKKTRRQKGRRAF